MLETHINNQVFSDPSIREIDEVAKLFSADLINGHTSEKALIRFNQDGPNEINSAPREPTWRKILSHFQEPLIYLLLIAVVIAMIAWGLEGFVGLPIDAIVIAIIVILNGILGFVQEAKAESAVASLSKTVAATSSVMRNSQVTRIPSTDLVMGDILILNEGDSVGADARLIEVAALRVQEASLTGESEAVFKDVTTLLKTAALGDRPNMVFKGTNILLGNGRAVVTAIGISTEMGAISTMLESTTEEPTPLQIEIKYIGRMLGIAIIVITAIVVGTILLLTEIRRVSDFVHVLLLGLSLAVAAVPEGLPAILSIVLALGVQRMAKHNAIVKKLSSVETLGSASVIASDKTGTLTRAEMTIERIITASGDTNVTGVGYTHEGHIELDGIELKDGLIHQEIVVLLTGGCLAGNAYLNIKEDDKWEIHGDPTDVAFLIAERKLSLTENREKRFERVSEIPFSSERKIMSVIVLDHENKNSSVLMTKGAPDILLEKCSNIKIGVDVVPLDDVSKAKILADIDMLSDSALRTLAVAYRTLDLKEDLSNQELLERGFVFVGIVGMFDPPREETAVAIEEAHKAGIRIIMITGDHPHTAIRIATDLKIVLAGATALTGLELDGLDDKSFAEAVRNTSVYARVSPAHKLRIVDALQADGNIVAMTGDGVNDAPALKASDIGIAMGITGTEVTKEAAKMILVDDNFATIVKAIREGRSILDNIRKFLRYLLSTNMGEVLTVFLGVVGASVVGLKGSDHVVLLPLLATQLLWINLITDSAPALAMGVDPPMDDLMTRKPKCLNERIINIHMWTTVIFIGLVIAIVTLFTIDFYLPGGLISGKYNIINARTAGFTTLVFCSLFTCFTSRSDTTSAFKNVFVNLWLWGAITLSIILQMAVVNLSFMNLAFGTSPLEFHQWLFCIAMASSVLWLSELYKWLIRYF